jgi:hypothetical protein
MRTWDSKLAGEVSFPCALELHLSPAYRFMILSQTSDLPIPRDVFRHIHELDALGVSIGSTDAKEQFADARPAGMAHYLLLRQSLERFFDSAFRFGGRHSENPASIEELQIVWRISSHELSSDHRPHLPEALLALEKNSRFATCAGEAINDYLEVGGFAAAKVLARSRYIASVADFLPFALADSARLSDSQFDQLIKLCSRAIRSGYQSASELSSSIQDGMRDAEKIVARIGSVYRLYTVQTAEQRVAASSLTPLLRAALQKGVVSDDVMDQMLRREFPNSLLPEVSTELVEIIFSRSSKSAKLTAIRLLRRATTSDPSQQQSSALGDGVKVFFQRLAKFGLPTGKDEAAAVIDLLKTVSLSLIQASATDAVRFCAKEISAPFRLRVWPLMSAWVPALKTSDLVTLSINHIELLKQSPQDSTCQTNGLMALEILAKIGPQAHAAVPSIIRLLGVDWSSAALRTLTPLSLIAPTSAAELGARAVEALAAIGSADRKVRSVFKILTHFSVDPVSRAARKALTTP